MALLPSWDQPRTYGTVGNDLQGPRGEEVLGRNRGHPLAQHPGIPFRQGWGMSVRRSTAGTGAAVVMVQETWHGKTLPGRVEAQLLDQTSITG